MAAQTGDSDSGPLPSRRVKPPSIEEWRFLSALLQELSEGEEDPNGVEHVGEAEDLIGRVRAGLLGHPGVSMSPQHQALSRQAKDELARRRALAGKVGSTGEAHGILTSVTRKLSPEMALQLYRRIAPMVVYQVLTLLEPSASFDEVRRIAEQLCDGEVQARLRACEHVRDGILDEICAALGRIGRREKTTRNQMHRVLEQCGAADDVMAMENCLKLTALRAG